MGLKRSVGVKMAPIATNMLSRLKSVEIEAGPTLYVSRKNIKEKKCLFKFKFASKSKGNIFHQAIF